MELIRELVWQCSFRNMTYDVDDKIARSGEWIENVNVLVRQRGLEFGLQNMLNARNHEIHKGLWRIHDAVRVSYFDGKPPEKAFIHGVEEIGRASCRERV